MAWPPPIPPAIRANSTAQLDTHPADHNAISAALTAMLPTAWTALPLAAGWTNLVDAATPFVPAQYRVVGDRVELRGTLVRTPATVGLFAIATMPVGARSLLRQIVGSAVITNGAVRVDIWAGAAGGGGGANELRTAGSYPATADFSFLSLGGLSWAVT